ncbi:MAG: YfhO family protein [Acidobacteria bacterium]|nr:YfhO family protein [Acidobacteriota bacterium]
MKLRLWWIPFLLVLAPMFGRVPEPRDVPGFFAPIRVATATRLRHGEWPWLNALNGCTEAWFANPETGVLYPPAWIHLALDPHAAISLEIGLHLALLALGIGVLSRRLGARDLGIAVAEAATLSSGAVLATVGMLNNLEAMAWMPWMILAARLPGRWTVPATAAAFAVGWLAGEPVVWLLGVVLALALAGDRRAAASLGLGLSLLIVAVQLLPFVSWVLEGDRGTGSPIQYLAGSVSPAGWTRVLVPGVPASATGIPWAASLFLGAPIVLLALLGIGKRCWIAVLAAALAVLATLPELGDGRLYLTLTHSLVRYPSRFAVLALLLLLPFAGTGYQRWMDGKGRGPAVLLALASLGLSFGAPTASGVGAVVIPSGLLLGAALLPRWTWLRGGAIAAGLLAGMAVGWPLLGLHTPQTGPWPWPETAGTGRVYTPAPSGPARIWLARSKRRLGLWPLGYLNLAAEVELVRSDAPLMHRSLRRHLEEADRGPAGRWWLDTLAARWMILTNPPPPGQRMRLVRLHEGMWLIDNLRALPWSTVWTARPAPGVALAPAILGIARPTPESLSVAITSPQRTWLSLALPPIRGWRLTLDGRPVRMTPGPGILQTLAVPPGGHRLAGRYCPPGFPATPILSGGTVAFTTLLALGAWIRRRGRVPVPRA